MTALLQASYLGSITCKFLNLRKNRPEVECFGDEVVLERDVLAVAAGESLVDGPAYRTVVDDGILSGALMGVMLMSTTCFAAGTGTSAVTQPLENLKTLIIAVIGAVGVIILAKNVMEFAQAYQQQDSSTMNSALKGIVAGVMMAGISTVLTFLGF